MISCVSAHSLTYVVLPEPTELQVNYKIKNLRVPKNDISLLQRQAVLQLLQRSEVELVVNGGDRLYCSRAPLSLVDRLRHSLVCF